MSRGGRIEARIAHSQARKGLRQRARCTKKVTYFVSFLSNRLASSR